MISTNRTSTIWCGEKRIVLALTWKEHDDMRSMNVVFAGFEAFANTRHGGKSWRTLAAGE